MKLNPVLRVLVCSWFVASLALAAPPTRDKGTRAKPPESASARTILSEGVAQLDQDIAARMLKRPDTAAADLPRLEMEIDLRIIQRWMLSQALEGKPDAELQAAVCLRWQTLFEATAALEAALKPGALLSASQDQAIKNLHQGTFNLPELRTLKDFDDLSQKIGTVLLGAAAAQPIDAKTLASVRPKIARAPRTESEKVERPTAAQLAEELKRMNLSPSLRQQISALATAAQDPSHSREYDLLSGVLELATGLSSNTALSPKHRTEVESQLTEGLALWQDPRTRNIGQSRIDSLQSYRSTLSRISHLNLPEATRTQLAPVFTWSTQNGEAGGKAMAAIDKFAQLRARYDARDKKTAPPVNLRKPVADVEKLFDTAAAAFPAAAVDLANSTGTPNPADLTSKLDEMQRCLDLLEKLDQMPRVLEQLAAYKPRPGGGLDRRAGILAAAAAAPAASVARNDALRSLDDLLALNRTAAELAAIPTQDIPAETAKAWTGGQLAAADAKWKAVIGDLASLAAGGGEIDRAKVGKLAGVAELLNALRQAAALDAAVEASPILSRWVDWRISPEMLKAIAAPYQDTMSEAFASLAKTGETNVTSWVRARDKYRPIVALVHESLAFREQCNAMPTGVNGALAGLLAPLEGAPFGPQRRASLGLSIWMRCIADDDEAAANEVLDAMGKRLAKDLRLD